MSFRANHPEFESRPEANGQGTPNRLLSFAVDQAYPVPKGDPVQKVADGPVTAEQAANFADAMMRALGYPRPTDPEALKRINENALKRLGGA